MAWQPVPSSYQPGSGERIRVRVSFQTIGPVSEGDVRSLVESAGLSVVSVGAGPSVIVVSPGGKSAGEIGEIVRSALADSARIFWVDFEGADRETTSLLPEPSPSLTISLVAVAIIALVGLWFARKVL